MRLTGGECHDAPEGRILIEELRDKYPNIPLLMDRAYEGDSTRKLAEECGFIPIVPPKKNRVEPWIYDKEKYKKRNIVERLNRRIKEFRKVCTRYDKTDVMFLAFIQFAFIVIWIR